MNEEDEYENGYDAAPLGEDDAFANVAQGLQGANKAQLVSYWQRAIDQIERIGEAGVADDAFKSTALPLARIKKVMKTDSDVRMISAEAPILFAKGCDIFISELTMRAWIHAEESKRRTLQRSDIATALQKSDMFDFLIDIVPREESQPRRYQATEETVPASNATGADDAAGRAPQGGVSSGLPAPGQVVTGHAGPLSGGHPGPGSAPGQPGAGPGLGVGHPEHSLGQLPGQLPQVAGRAPIPGPLQGQPQLVGPSQVPGPGFSLAQTSTAPGLAHGSMKLEGSPGAQPSPDYHSADFDYAGAYNGSVGV